MSTGSAGLSELLGILYGDLLFAEAKIGHRATAMQPGQSNIDGDANSVLSRSRP